MPDFSKRSDEIEIMDDLNYSGVKMDQTLRELEVINKWLGGNRVTLDGINRLLRNRNEAGTITIADLGCGKGGMLHVIAGWTRKNDRTAKLLGIDANPYIIDLARKSLRPDQQIQFQAIDVFSPAFRSQRFDIVIGTLFFHHFTEKQLVTFFTQLKDQVTIGFIINDVHRHPLAFYSIKLLTALFSKSSMVKYDAPLSVLRAFKKDELIGILQKSGIENFTIKWKWAFRWQVLVYKV